MRKLLFVVIIASAAGIVALTTPARAAASHHDQVTGTGTLGQFGDPTAHVNAIQTAAGLKGGFTIAYPDGTFVVGSAACLVVSATRHSSPARSRARAARACNRKTGRRAATSSLALWTTAGRTLPDQAG